MRRRRVTLMVTAAVAVCVAGGLSVGVLRSPAAPSSAAQTRPTVIRDRDSTVYIAPSGILFDVDSAALSADAVPVLRSIADDIARSRLTGTVRVEGYTDSSGSEGYNLGLSRDRADTVAAWLVAEGGIDRARIEVVGFGEASPVADNDTEDHRRANRRVVIAVLR